MTTAVTPNHHVAAIIGAPCYMLWNLFSGFMIPHKVWKLMLYCLYLQFKTLIRVIVTIKMPVLDIFPENIQVCSTFCLHSILRVFTN